MPKPISDSMHSQYTTALSLLFRAAPKNLMSAMIKFGNDQGEDMVYKMIRTIGKQEGLKKARKLNSTSRLTNVQKDMRFIAMFAIAAADAGILPAKKLHLLLRMTVARAGKKGMFDVWTSIKNIVIPIGDAKLASQGRYGMRRKHYERLFAGAVAPRKKRTPSPAQLEALKLHQNSKVGSRNSEEQPVETASSLPSLRAKKGKLIKELEKIAPAEYIRTLTTTVRLIMRGGSYTGKKQNMSSSEIIEAIRKKHNAIFDKGGVAKKAIGLVVSIVKLEDRMDNMVSNKSGNEESSFKWTEISEYIETALKKPGTFDLDLAKKVWKAFKGKASVKVSNVNKGAVYLAIYHKGKLSEDDCLDLMPTEISSASQAKEIKDKNKNVIGHNFRCSLNKAEASLETATMPVESKLKEMKKAGKTLIAAGWKQEVNAIGSFYKGKLSIEFGFVKSVPVVLLYLNNSEKKFKEKTLDASINSALEYLKGKKDTASMEASFEEEAVGLGTLAIAGGLGWLMGSLYKKVVEELSAKARHKYAPRDKWMAWNAKKVGKRGVIYYKFGGKTHIQSVTFATSPGEDAKYSKEYRVSLTNAGTSIDQALSSFKRDVDRAVKKDKRLRKKVHLSKASMSIAGVGSRLEIITAAAKIAAKKSEVASDQRDFDKIANRLQDNIREQFGLHIGKGDLANMIREKIDAKYYLMKYVEPDMQGLIDDAQADLEKADAKRGEKASFNELETAGLKNIADWVSRKFGGKLSDRTLRAMMSEKGYIISMFGRIPGAPEEFASGGMAFKVKKAKVGYYSQLVSLKGKIIASCPLKKPTKPYAKYAEYVMSTTIGAAIKRYSHNVVKREHASVEAAAARAARNLAALKGEPELAWGISEKYYVQALDVLTDVLRGKGFKPSKAAPGKKKIVADGVTLHAETWVKFVRGAKYSVTLTPTKVGDNFNTEMTMIISGSAGKARYSHVVQSNKKAKILRALKVLEDGARKRLNSPETKGKRAATANIEALAAAKGKRAGKKSKTPAKKSGKSKAKASTKATPKVCRLTKEEKIALKSSAKKLGGWICQVNERVNKAGKTSINVLELGGWNKTDTGDNRWTLSKMATKGIPLVNGNAIVDIFVYSGTHMDPELETNIVLHIKAGRLEKITSPSETGSPVWKR